MHNNNNDNGPSWSVYLAGKIGKNDWRHDVVPSLRDLGGSLEPWLWQHWQHEPTIYRDVFYTGPYFTGCDHGCAHQPNQHGFARETVCGQECPKELVTELCCSAIAQSDVFFAWLGPDGPLDDCTAYGTLAELGFAKALGCLVVTAAPCLDTDLWFAHHLADRTIVASDPLSALSSFVPKAVWSLQYQGRNIG